VPTNFIVSFISLELSSVPELQFFFVHVIVLFLEMKSFDKIF